MSVYVQYSAIGLVFCLETLYLIRRRNYLASQSNAQTRVRWNALFTVLLLVGLKWVALQLLFLLAWGRVQHLTFEPNKRQVAWFTGFAITTTALALTLAFEESIFAWFFLWLALLAQSFVALCSRDRGTTEYDHLVWAHIFYLLAVIPPQFASCLWPSPHFDTANWAILTLLYIRMRAPLVFKSFFFDSEVPNDLDLKSVYEAVEHPRELQAYLLKVDPTIRRLFLLTDSAFDAYVRGDNIVAERIGPIAEDLQSIGIEHPFDILQTRKYLLDYMHYHYDWKILGPFARFRDFFCPCVSAAPPTPLELMIEDLGHELDSVEAINESEDEPVVYVNFDSLVDQ